jgi:hypothetical protein
MDVKPRKPRRSDLSNARRAVIEPIFVAFRREMRLYLMPVHVTRETRNLNHARTS